MTINIRAEVTPEYLNDNKNRAIKLVSPYLKGRILEVGPSFPAEWDTIDTADHEWLTYRKVDPYQYPILDCAYDTVYSTHVMEHVPMPWEWLKELARITVPGGHILLVTPVNWPQHAAVDCWRAYPDGMRAILEWNHLQCVFCEMVTGGTPEGCIDLATVARRSND